MIRKGQLSDAEAIAKLLVNIWQVCYQDFLPKPFLDGLNITKQTERQKRLIRSGITYYIYENEEKEYLGFTSFGPPRSADILADIELYTLYVHPFAQKKGIGKILLEQIIKEQPIPNQTMGVLVMEKNPYQSFYHKNDFLLQGKQIMDLGDFSETNLILVKQL